MATIRVQPTSSDFVAISVMEHDSRGNPKLVKQILLTPKFAETRFIDMIKNTCIQIKAKQAEQAPVLVPDTDDLELELEEDDEDPKDRMNKLTAMRDKLEAEINAKFRHLEP